MSSIASWNKSHPKKLIPITPHKTTVLVRSEIPRMPRAPSDKQNMLKRKQFHHVNRCVPPVLAKLTNAAIKYKTPIHRSTVNEIAIDYSCPIGINIPRGLNRIMASQEDIVASLMRLKTFRDSEVLYEDRADGTRHFTGLKQVSIRALRGELKSVPFEINFDGSDNNTVRIRFGVAPKQGVPDIVCPSSMVNSRGTLCVQSHRRTESLHSADMYAWLDETADSFDIIVYSTGYKTLRCRGALRQLKNTRPELFNRRVRAAAGKRK